MTSRASAITSLVGLLALGCGPEPVDARAIWVDDFGGEGSRRIHVYDRGEIEEIEVLGASEPVERVRLDTYGRGFLIRSGEAGAWFDLDDGRRFPLRLPPSGFGGPPPVSFADGALTWIDEFDGSSLVVVPLAPGLALARADDGTVEPLRRESGLDWSIPAARAPMLFVADVAKGQASFLRYPTGPDEALVIALEAKADGLSLPTSARELHGCDNPLGCFAQVAVEPRAELAIFSASSGGPWELFDRRAPKSAGPLALPTSMAEAQASTGLRLLAVLDRAVSIWLGSGQLYRYDRARETVDSLPVFALPPLTWTSADAGRAVILASFSGPVYRADLDGLRAVSLETTTCAGAGVPVVSPNGRWVAWTCIDHEAELPATSGVVVRVSRAGLERFVGVPMSTLAIDDAGDLLLYSVESSYNDEVDGVGPTSLPRNLFSLAGDGVLTRVDELEPAPAPVLVGSREIASYIQAVALGD